MSQSAATKLVSKVSEDTILVDKFLAGDQDSFNQLVTKHNRYVIKWAQKFSRRYEVEDIAQNAWLKVFLKLHQWRRECSFKTWLTIVIRTAVLEQFRKEKKEGTQFSLEERIEILGDSDEVLAYREQEIDNLPNKQLLQKAIAKLNPRQRNLLNMYLMGMTYAEIAEVLNKPIGTVKHMAFRAKQAMRRTIKRNDKTKPAVFGN